MTKKKAGRPTKQPADINKKVKEYIAEVNYPSVAGFAVWLGVGKQTVYDWASRDPEVKAALEELNSYIETVLLDNIMEGKKTPVGSIFLLKANHKYIETSRQEITGKDGEALTGGVFVKDLHLNFDKPKQLDNVIDAELSADVSQSEE